MCPSVTLSEVKNLCLISFICFSFSEKWRLPPFFATQWTCNNAVFRCAKFGQNALFSLLSKACERNVFAAFEQKNNLAKPARLRNAQKARRPIFQKLRQNFAPCNAFALLLRKLAPNTIFLGCCDFIESVSRSLSIGLFRYYIMLQRACQVIYEFRTFQREIFHKFCKKTHLFLKIGR